MAESVLSGGHACSFFFDFLELFLKLGEFAIFDIEFDNLHIVFGFLRILLGIFVGTFWNLKDERIFEDGRSLLPRLGGLEYLLDLAALLLLLP